MGACQIEVNGEIKFTSFLWQHSATESGYSTSGVMFKSRIVLLDDCFKFWFPFMYGELSKWHKTDLFNTKYFQCATSSSVLKYMNCNTY